MTRPYEHLSRRSDIKKRAVSLAPQVTSLRRVCCGNNKNNQKTDFGENHEQQPFVTITSASKRTRNRDRYSLSVVLTFHFPMPMIPNRSAVDLDRSTPVWNPKQDGRSGSDGRSWYSRPNREPTSSRDPTIDTKSPANQSIING